MSDKLRAAAQAVLESTKSFSVYCENFCHLPRDLHDDGECPPWRRYNDALTALEAAVEEPAIKESLTVRPWVGLTEEEIESLQRLAIDPVDANGWGFLNRESYAHLIEAKLKEKNYD